MENPTSQIETAREKNGGENDTGGRGERDIVRTEFNSAHGPFSVRVHFKFNLYATRIILKILPERIVQLTIPPGVFFNNAVAFMHSKSDWIRKCLEKMVIDTPQGFSTFLTIHPDLEIEGVPCKIELGETKAMPFFIYNTDERRVIFRHRGGEFCENDLKNLLRELAEKNLPPLIGTLAKETGISYKKVSIRDQKSRWGSCATSGVISLNWRAILLPLELQKHLIYHELAHRIFMNHSGKFWKQVAAWDPNWEENDRRISKNYRMQFNLGQKI